MTAACLNFRLLVAQVYRSFRYAFHFCVIHDFGNSCPLTSDWTSREVNVSFDSDSGENTV